MNYTLIVSEIKSAAEKRPNINSVMEGDIYKNWHWNVKYSAINISLENTSIKDGLATYNIVLYYGDRLRTDGKNRVSIWDDGIKILNDIISDLGEESDEDFSYEGPLVYTPFEQEFEDVLAGVYVRIGLMVPSDLVC